MKNQLLIFLLVLSNLFVQAQNTFFKTYSITNGGWGEEESGKCVRQLSNGNYLLLGMSGDGLMLNMIDNQGLTLSSNTISYSGHSLFANQFIETSNGDILIVGSAYSLSMLSHKTLAIRCDLSGTIIWSKEYDGSIALSVTETASGNFAIAGQEMQLFMVDSNGLVVSPNGITQFSGLYNGLNDIKTTVDGGMIMSGDPDGSIGSYDAALIKTDEFGNLQWQKFYGGLNYDWMGKTVLQTSDEGFFMCGSTNSFGNTPGGNEDFYLIKTDYEGNLEWSKTYGTNSQDFASGAVLTPDGGFAVVGWTGESDDFFAYDAVIFKVDSQGNLVWSNVYDHLDMDGASFIDLTSDGGFVFTGGALNMWPQPSDNYIFKTNSLGVVSDVCSVNLALTESDAATQVINDSYSSNYPITASNANLQIISSSPQELIVCESVSDFICRSNTGIEIFDIGYWENPNEPCETGECNSDGQFFEIVIDCEEEMGMPCNGEWVEVEGQCCSECVESVDISEIDNEELRLKKMIDILGREQQKHKKGSLLFYIYDNGKVEKKFNP